MLFTAAKRCSTDLQRRALVFNDSALPTLDVEMINTLRGTGIQVELHEVKMMTLIIAIIVIGGSMIVIRGWNTVSLGAS